MTKEMAETITLAVQRTIGNMGVAELRELTSGVFVDSYVLAA